MMSRLLPLAIAISSAAALAQGSVTLRGEREPLPSALESVSSHGVSLQDDPGAIITWDRIKHLDADAWTDYASIAQDAWRARARLERGDIVLAAPLYKQLFETYQDDPGLMLAFAAHGHRVCLVAIGRHDDAITPMLVAHASSPERTNPSDPTTPQPIWLTGDAPDLDAYLENDSEIARLFAVAARFEREGIEHTPASSEAPAHPVLRDIVVSRISGDAGQRKTARERLVLEAQRHDGTWREARARLAIGRSLLRESDRDARLAAIIEFANVGARFRSAAPRLAAIALAETIREVERASSSPGSARTLRAALERVPGSSFAQTWIDTGPQRSEPEN